MRNKYQMVGSLPEGYEAVNIKLNPDTVFLQDLESIINNIKVLPFQ